MKNVAGVTIRAPKMTQREAVYAIRNRQPFVASNLSGGLKSVGTPLGDLPDVHRVQILADWHAARRNEGAGLYVVWSYDTPIAWSWTDDEGEHVRMPNVRYSITTSAHQGIVCRAWDITPDWRTQTRAVPVGHYSGREGW